MGKSLEHVISNIIRHKVKYLLDSEAQKKLIGALIVVMKEWINDNMPKPSKRPDMDACPKIIPLLIADKMRNDTIYEVRKALEI